MILLWVIILVIVALVLISVAIFNPYVFFVQDETPVAVAETTTTETEQQTT